MASARYFTGKPCVRGHVAERYLSTRTCVQCAAVRCAEWQHANRRKYLDAQNKSRRTRLYGVSPEQYAAMLEKQAGGCAICAGVNRTRQLAVDHDHGCCPGERTCGQCIRGLLCDACNHGLGKFRDSRSLLLRAAEYLNNG